MQCGSYAKLQVSRFVEFGAYLIDAKTHEEVLLPRRYLPSEITEGSTLEVFLYTDSEDRLVATTLRPFATYKQVAALEVVSIVANGCYLDLGIAKDIFMPSRNPAKFSVGEMVVVWIDLDREGRLIARLGVKDRLKRAPLSLKRYSMVEVIPFESSALGYGCVVNNCYFGMLFTNELFEEIKIGARYSAYIQAIRPDGKIDLRLGKPKQAGGIVDDMAKIIALLKKENRPIGLHYDSPPEEIKRALGMSKKSFKRALTQAIQEKLIELMQSDKGLCLMLKWAC